MLDVLALDNDGHTDHPISCHDVKQQGFAFLGCRQDRGDVRNCLRSAKVASASSDYSNFSFALRSLNNGRPFSPSRDMKRVGL
jgi:hypothetical protein